MKSIKDIDVSGLTVLLRLDLNVPIKDGVIVDTTRIDKSLVTINYLLSKNAKVVVMSHLGRIKTLDDKINNSLKVVSEYLSRCLDKRVYFFDSSVGINLKNDIDKIDNGNLIVLENTRYLDLDNNKEKNSDEELSKYYASLGNIFVNDAFGVSHRQCASNYGVSKYINTYIGFLMEDEINNLNNIVNNDKWPFTVFMGGAKVEDKLPIIKGLLTKCDYLLLGGGILNSFLKASDIDVKNSLATNDETILNELRELLDVYRDKIIMSKELVYRNDRIMDIGIDVYRKYLGVSKIVFVNGAPGVFEEEGLDKGTKDLLSELDKIDADVYLGGGDTINALKKYDYIDNFKFVSTGGGATLEYISTGKIKCFDIKD